MRIIVFLIINLAGITIGWSQIYNANPDWRSSDRRYATGGQFADINGDGWPDLVVSNGNDIRQERVIVYYNQNGVLQTSPGWQSNDVGYHGHLAIGDINRDGWPDVAVTRLLAQGGYGVKVYRNLGGVLELNPSWVSAVNFNGWHAAFGDPDGDGDLDLMVGSSEAYGSNRWPNYIFFNQNGQLNPQPGWVSQDNRNLDHMSFADLDDDGDLDVVAIGSATANWIYRNQNGIVATVTDWNSTDNFNQFANTLALGDLTGDGMIDLIMSDNNQINNGSGRFKLYRNLGNGYFEQTPSWSYFDGYVSGIALADLNNDGKLDLATGAWWDYVRLFINTGNGLPAQPTWTSAVRLVVEAICFADVNKDGLKTKLEGKNIFNGKTIGSVNKTPFAGGLPLLQTPRKLYYLDHRPIEKIHSVIVDGVELPLTEYCEHLVNGWVSLKNIPQRSVAIRYTYSTRLDMAVTDWENNGNILFYHRQ